MTSRDPGIESGLDALVLRAAGPEDQAAVFEWANHPITLAASLVTGAIDREEHVAWFERALADPRRRLFIALFANRRVGLVRLDWVGEREAEVALVVAPGERGREMGRRSLGLIGERATSLGLERLTAWIRADHAAQAKAFEAAGFRRIGEQEVRGERALRYELSLGWRAPSDGRDAARSTA